jgi:hypothetical protein
VITSAELPTSSATGAPGEVVPVLRCRACPTMMAVACTSRCHRNDAVRSMWSIGLWVNRSMWLWIRTVSSALLAWHATAALVCGRPI